MEKNRIMEHVSNEEKARRLCCSGCNNYVCYTNKKQCPTLKDLLTMAKWKDEQREKEKQQWIDKAAEWLRMTMDFFNNGEFNTDKFVNDFKQEMKGE